MRKQIEQLVKVVEGAEALDPALEKVAALVNAVTGPRLVKNGLSGSWLGHPVHPLLVAIPIGAWTSACAIDVLGGDGSDEAGTFLVGLGLAAAVPTVATGLANWSDLYGAERRLGAVHATANILATACYASSFLARRRGRRGAGKVLALAGMGAMSVGGWLGGHLTYRLGVGVDHTAFQADSEQWTTVAHMAELTDGKATVVEVDGVPVLLVREGDSVRALADTCTHESGRLHEGEVSDGCVTCPLHGSQFRLADGEVVRGPATAPQRLYHARVIGRDVLVCAV